MLGLLAKLLATAFSNVCAAAPEGSPRELNGSARIYVVLAILGSALALSVISCLLFYVVGRRSGSKPGTPEEKQDE